jgi:PAS domain S-box-containing protein
MVGGVKRRKGSDDDLDEGIGRAADMEPANRIGGSLLLGVVLIAGILLSIMVFSILNGMIKTIVAEDMKQDVAETRDTVTESIVDLQHTVSSVTTTIGISHDAPRDELQAQIVTSLPADNKFDRFVWLRRDEAGKWGMIDLISFKGSDKLLPELSGVFDPALINHIITSRPRNPRDVFVLADLPGTQARQETLDPLVEGRPMLVAKTILVAGKDAGVIVGITRTSRLLKDKWLQNRKDVLRIGISDTSYGLLVYYIDKQYEGGQPMANFNPEWKFDMQVGQKIWQLQIDMGDGADEGFIHKMPWLAAFSVMILAFVVMFFLRNSQGQGLKVAAMNRALAQKNYELNSQMAERERLNHFLRKAEREYRAIIDSVSDVIFEAATSGEIMFLNDTFTRITGFQVEQATNRNLFDMLHPQEQQEQRQHFEELVRGKRNAYRSFTRLRTSDGTFRSVELAISMLRQDENKNMRVVGTLTDVEERRRAERALSEAEKKYRQIVENAAGGIYQVTPEGQFLSANKAMARILGYDLPEQMLREVRNAHDIYASSKDRSRFVRELEAAGTVNNFEAQVFTRDKKKIWINENARSVKDDEGNVLYFEGSLENVTQRKEAELKLREAKVQSDLANRAKSEFLANMSHELRTPLNAIIGFSEIIKNEVLGPLENRNYWEYARDIFDSGKRLLTIINEILDVSRIEAGDRQLNEGSINLANVVKSCVDFMMPKAESGSINIINMVTGNVPNLIGEELAIKQVLLNLLSNAVKYTPGGGRVTIAHEIDSHGQFRISITDTGVGLDEGEIQKALSPFGQVDTSLAREGSGAGLGLTLVDSLMKMHGGRLELFSQKGIGTTATVIFPAKRVAQEGGAKGAGGSGDAGAPPKAPQAPLTAADYREPAAARESAPSVLPQTPREPAPLSPQTPVSERRPEDYQPRARDRERDYPPEYSPGNPPPEASDSAAPRGNVPRRFSEDPEKNLRRPAAPEPPPSQAKLDEAEARRKAKLEEISNPLDGGDTIDDNA